MAPLILRIFVGVFAFGIYDELSDADRRVVQPHAENRVSDGLYGVGFSGARHTKQCCAFGYDVRRGHLDRYRFRRILIVTAGRVTEPPDFNTGFTRVFAFGEVDDML